MSASKIEWTDATWNPTRGCSRVSDGCRNCYAERIAARFSTHALQEGDEPGGVFAGYAINTPSGPRWTRKVELIESKLYEPLSWRKPRRIFVNSMSDLFHEALPGTGIMAVFRVMGSCPQHTFQVLTKRPARMLEILSKRHWRDTAQVYLPLIPNERERGDLAFLPNVWLGVSVEDQPTADERVPLLLQTPAAVRFVSYEPALEPVDFRRWLACDGHLARSFGNRFLDWIIIGGESGAGARPFDIAWARNTVAQCKAAGVACFVKQLGSRSNLVDWMEVRQMDRKGGDWNEWPEDLRVRQFPEARAK